MARQKAVISFASQQSGNAYKNFISSLDSEASRRTYRNSFSHFMQFYDSKLEPGNYEAMLAIQPAAKLEALIRDFIIYMREEKRQSAATIMTHCATIAHFYEMNDVQINWKKLKKFKGKMRRVVDDVPYTREQIKSLVNRASLRDRCIILTMASAGLRRGALPDLRLKDLEKIDKYGLYKITAYKNEQESYITYCTPECAKAIDEYLDWRQRLGEQLKPNTPVFRKEFDVTSPMFIARPQPITPGTISQMMAHLLDRTGVRPTTHEMYSKTGIMQCHGFRKFFDTQCINHNMNPIYAEYLMGHKTGLIKSYFKPADTELLEGNDQSRGYTSIIPYLTINATEEENQRLKAQITKLEEHHSEEWESMRKQVTEIKQRMGFMG